jgi:hypothetical protein
MITTGVATAALVTPDGNIPDGIAGVIVPNPLA